RTLEFAKPERPADLIWRKASIDVENGPEGEVFIPVRYPCPNAAGWDDQLRLGRATTWSGEGTSAVIGLGQKMFLIGDETKSSLEIDKLAIAPS
ncbi:MAG TPA: type VI secretion system accessory protein TagJ, partial [Pirellula sp.]|nr:type VI secretion system accessory protein TagJ [Pirellula sp.]